MTIKGIIFDLDGTLGDTFPVIFPAYRNALLKHTGRTYSDADIVALFGPSEDGIMRTLAPDRWEACLDEYIDEYRRLTPTETIHFEGMADALRLLRRRGVLLGIVTGKSHPSALISLAELGIADYFDALEGGSADGVIKPECMRRILARWRMAPEEAAYVGDAILDMHNAREVGVLPLAAGWCDKADKAGLQQTAPAVLFSQVADFRRWIETNIPSPNGHH